MRKYLLLLLSFSALLASAKPKLPEELSENVYSNVRECLEYALVNEDAKIYVEAVRGYTGAMANLSILAAALAKQKEKTTDDREKLVKLNKLLTSWRLKLEELEAPAQLEAYETLKSDYNYRLLYLKEALKTRSPLVIQTNFYNCFSAYGRTLRQGEKVRLEHKEPESIDPYWQKTGERLSEIMTEQAGAYAFFDENAVRTVGYLSSGTNLQDLVQLTVDCLAGKAAVDRFALDKCYALLLDELPLSYTYWEAWGDLRLRMGDTNGALRVWKKGLKRFQKDFDFRYLLAYYSPGTEEGCKEAVEYLKDCLEMTGGSAASRISLMMARRYLALGSYGEAYASAQDAAKLARLSRSPTSDNEYREARLFAARLALRYELLDAALENLEKLTINDIYDAEIAEEMAKVRYAMFMKNPASKELLQDALKAFDKLSSFRPSQKGIAAAKAVMNYQAGNMAEARKQAMKELSVSPSDASSLTVLGYVFLSEGKKGEAKASFEAALRSDPEYQKAKEGLELSR
ncbi:hypothetical protein J6T93_07730 [bacterium]|nr:hypothetical protein [bacterium]